MKLKLFFLTLVLTSSLLFSSCLAWKYNKWIGKNQTQLIDSFGAPDNITSDGGSGKILVYYTESSTKVKLSPLTSIGGTKYSTTQSSLNFFVNSDGIIRKWLARK